MNTLPADYLPDVVEKIKDALAKIDAAGRSAVTEAVNAGLLLAQAKSRIPHGQWLPWLADNFALGERTAQSYMQLARSAPDLSRANPQAVADLTIQGALKAIAQPRTPKPAPEPQRPADKPAQVGQVSADKGGDDFDPWQERQRQDAPPIRPAPAQRRESQGEHALLSILEAIAVYLRTSTDGSPEAMHERMDKLADTIHARIDGDAE